MFRGQDLPPSSGLLPPKQLLLLDAYLQGTVESLLSEVVWTEGTSDNQKVG
jgi:hypothetical protein